MKFMKQNNGNFSRVLEPIQARFVSAHFIVNMNESQAENIEKIEFSPPKIGDENFGKFKITYKTPQFCEVNR